MTHNSRKAWKTIRKLYNDPTTSNAPCLVSANQVAHQLIVNGRGSIPTKPKHPVLLPATEGIPFQRRRIQERSGNTEEQQSLWQ